MFTGGLICNLIGACSGAWINASSFVSFTLSSYFVSSVEKICSVRISACFWYCSRVTLSLR